MSRSGVDSGICVKGALPSPAPPVVSSPSYPFVPSPPQIGGPGVSPPGKFLKSLIAVGEFWCISGKKITTGHGIVMRNREFPFQFGAVITFEICYRWMTLFTLTASTAKFQGICRFIWLCAVCSRFCGPVSGVACNYSDGWTERWLIAMLAFSTLQPSSLDFASHSIAIRR